MSAFQSDTFQNDAYQVTVVVTYSNGFLMMLGVGA
jgi:hypothetical protein